VVFHPSLSGFLGPVCGLSGNRPLTTGHAPVALSAGRALVGRGVIGVEVGSGLKIDIHQLRHTHATELNGISIEADAVLGLTPASSASAATPPTRLPTRPSRSTPATTGQDLRDRPGPRACPHWARLRRRSAVAATLSCCRIDDDRRPGKFFKEVREGVSDRGGGVRSRGEAAHKGRRQGKGTAIMKLTTMTQVTLDGVMQGNGAASDDRRNGFERGGWARRAGDDETRTFITQTYQRAEAFLFGRRTYELFAGSWGSIDQMRAHPIGVALNEAPKYVASTTLTAPRWEDTTVLRGDLAAAISELKAKPGGELQVHGSGALTRWLLEHDLVDEMTLIVVPVVLGQGARLFPETGPDLAFDLVESRVDSKGVTIQVYRPAGRPRYATA
jgi:dihydrofolate reductase